MHDVKLDPERVLDAQRRSEELRETADDHERIARSLREQARVLRVRWGLDPAPEWRIAGVPPASVTNDTDSDPSDV